MRADGAWIRSGVAVAAALSALVLAPGASAAERTRPDAPSGLRPCPQARAWNGFFHGAVVSGTTCARARSFVRAYARRATGVDLPRRVRGFSCAVRVRRTADGDVYASRHACVRGRVTIRFLGMA